MLRRVGIGTTGLAGGALLVLVALAAAAGDPSPSGAGQSTEPPASSGLKLSSPDIATGQTLPLQQVYDRLGCQGRNVSPTLEWSGAPPGTQSFALTVYNPDTVLLPEGFWQWGVYDLPKSTRRLGASAGSPNSTLLPTGAFQARNGLGHRRYDGPCPTPGSTNRIFFRLYALKVARLQVAHDASALDVDTAAKANALGKAEIVAVYGR